MNSQIKNRDRKVSFFLAPGAGLEPATSKLTASCSTIELPGKIGLFYIKAGGLTTFLEKKRSCGIMGR